MARMSQYTPKGRIGKWRENLLLSFGVISRHIIKNKETNELKSVRFTIGKNIIELSDSEVRYMLMYLNSAVTIFPESTDAKTEPKVVKSYRADRRPVGSN